MSTKIDSTDVAQSNTFSEHNGLNKNQKELEGQMALDFIQSSNIDSISVPINRGQNIDIQI